MVTDILVHYGELALKGKNRPMFIKQLETNIRQALKGLPVSRVRRLPGRLLVIAKEGRDLGEEALERIATVYGIATYSPALRCPLKMEAIEQTALSLVQNREYESFRVTTRRPFKEVPFRSQELNRDLGAFLYSHRPAKVKMKGADLEVHVDLLPEHAYIYADRHVGLRGLPVGVTGKVCVMLSGGIDSPVAAARMMRRGCRVTFVHFHGHPFVTRASLEKAEELAELLVRHQYDATLYSVPFGQLQGEIVETVPPPLRVVLYRRFMLRIATRIAKEKRCQVLVTGESLAQVASQTLSNMVVIEEAAGLPILRPLVAMDKQEIVDQAKALGSYEISIQPDQDCCTLFMPKHPETRARLRTVLAVEEALDIDRLVEDALERTEQSELRAPWYHERQKDGA